MNLPQHILNTLPVFEIEQPLEGVIQFFENTSFSHVAITEDGRFLGLLPENDLACFDSEKPISDFRDSLEVFAVTKETSWLDILEEFARHEANILPVVDQQQRVQGYYDLNEVVTVFIDTPFFTEPGSILVIATGLKDYSFSEIAQIVESNNTRILGAFISGMQNDVVQLTLKLSSESMNEVIQTFRRYNYNILFGNNDDQFMEDLKQRSDYLDKYLNV